MDCLICGKPVPGYKPRYCCGGHECACQGKPVDPCVCSDLCSDALFKYIGHRYEERRKLAGIERYQKPKKEEL